MQTNNRTEIATLGEFGLIKHLTKDIEIQNSETQYGVGDDAAVLEFKEQQTLVTTDLFKAFRLQSCHSQFFRHLCHERYS